MGGGGCRPLKTMHEIVSAHGFCVPQLLFFVFVLKEPMVSCFFTSVLCSGAWECFRGPRVTKYKSHGCLPFDEDACLLKGMEPHLYIITGYL